MAVVRVDASDCSKVEVKVGLKVAVLAGWMVDSWVLLPVAWMVLWKVAWRDEWWAGGWENELGSLKVDDLDVVRVVH